MHKVQHKNECSQVQIERAANGWVVTPSYPEVYGRDVRCEVASTTAQALEIAKRLMTVPFITETEEY